jgi:FAD/FMN-containing dehydrogenase
MSMPSLRLPAPPAGIRFDTEPQALDQFVRSHAGPCTMPLGIAQPRDDGEIARLVAWANAHALPLIPVSSPGGPRRRADTALRKPAVVMLLSAMDRVIHVDGRDRIAVIEPGVTFPAFDEALRPHGLRSMKPLLPRRSKSVLAAFLEREPIIAPQDHWDSSDPLASLSITFGSGERFRTGGGALPGTLEENLQRGNRQMMASGPIGTDYTRVLLGAQGTLGIAGWASIYCEPLPDREDMRLYGADDCAVLLELARLLALRQLGTHCFLLDRAQAAAALADDEAEFERVLMQAPPWVLYVSLTAVGDLPDGRMAWQRADLAQLAQASGARMVDEDGALSAQRLGQRLQQMPQTFYKDVPRGAHTEVFCLTQFDRVPQLLESVRPVFERFRVNAAQPADLLAGCYVQPTIQGTGCHLEITLFHAAGAAGLAPVVERELVTSLMQAGGFFSRPYGPWAQAAYERDPGIVPHLRKIKRLFDPQGVLNPGQLCF